MASQSAADRPAGPGSSSERPARMTPLRDQSKRQAVMNAINRFELTATDAWHDLEALSAGTRFDEIDAVPEGLFAVEGNGFTAIATVYVDLVDDDMEGASAYPDNFPAEVRGHFDASGEAIIETVSVDTSSFYA